MWLTGKGDSWLYSMDYNGSRIEQIKVWEQNQIMTMHLAKHMAFRWAHGEHMLSLVMCTCGQLLEEVNYIKIYANMCIPLKYK